jgi:hypothetical protein
MTDESDREHMIDDEAPPSAAESLRLIREQRAAAGRSLSPDPRLTFWPWGTAWLIGFALLYLRFGPDGRVTVDLPDWLPLTTLYTLMAAAAITSGIAGARAFKDVTGESSTKGMRYGFAWFLGFAGIAVLAARVGALLPDAEKGLLWAAASVGLVAVLYMAGAAIWNDRGMFVLGIWIGLINIVGVLAGPGWHALVVSLAGGGGLLVAGLVTWLRWRRRP